MLETKADAQRLIDTYDDLIEGLENEIREGNVDSAKLRKLRIAAGKYAEKQQELEKIAESLED